MATVTQRLVCRGLASAEVHILAFGGTVFHWGKAAALMRTIAKRLILALAAGTPPVVFPLLNLDGNWRVTGANSLGHGLFPLE
jgi:hypothetical protein